jgi:hypothetical protein
MELTMDQRIVWDPSKLKQIDEAKSKIMTFKKQGYEILMADGSPMSRFSSTLCEVIVKAKKILKKNVLKILCEKGDERIVWDKDNGREAKEAKAKFLELLKKGYKAYSVDNNSQKNIQIEEFDIDAEEILMIPQTVAG